MKKIFLMLSILGFAGFAQAEADYERKQQWQVESNARAASWRAGKLWCTTRSFVAQPGKKILFETQDKDYSFSTDDAVALDATNDYGNTITVYEITDENDDTFFATKCRNFKEQPTGLAALFSAILEVPANALEVVFGLARDVVSGVVSGTVEVVEGIYDGDYDAPNVSAPERR